MTTINGRVCVANGTPVDKVFSNDKQVYGRNLFKNTGNLSATTTTTTWGVLFDSSQIYNSGIKSLSGVSAMTFSCDVYVPLDFGVGWNIPIQFKGQNPQATNVGIDDYNTLIGLSNYVIKQNDLGKTIRTSFSIGIWQNYKSFDTALADTSSITIRQSSDTSGFVYSKIKLEAGTLPTPQTPAPEDVLK